jgi:N6-L-threonylcarbamoyladenine synthase
MLLVSRPLRSQSRRIFRRCLLTLAIESSCDDTAVAILEKNGSQATLHFNDKITSDNAHLQGIHPIIALESHEENLAGLIQKAIARLPRHHLSPVLHNESSKADLSNALQIPDFISVTRGPGMRSNLSTGLSTAKGLAVAWGVPLIGVHHMQAHALTPRLVSALRAAPGSEIQPCFPFFTLLVSGGHTLLVRSHDIKTHQILATTVDIALGDCLDKAARSILPNSILSSAEHTSYGALLETFTFSSSTDYRYSPPPTRAAEIDGSPTTFGWRMPTPLANTRTMRFSFTGIDSHARRIIGNRIDSISEEESKTLARETMRAAFEHIASRIVMALEAEVNPSPTLVVSGGVASNGFLRHILSSYLSERGFARARIEVPPIHLCTDNAAMVGWAGCEMFETGHKDSLQIRALPSWSLRNLLTPDVEESGKSWTERNKK